MSLSDERFTELSNLYRKNKVPTKDVLIEICRSTKSYNIATADFMLIVDRDLTSGEKDFIRKHVGRM